MCQRFTMYYVTFDQTLHLYHVRLAHTRIMRDTRMTQEKSPIHQTSNHSVNLSMPRGRLSPRRHYFPYAFLKTTDAC